VTETARSGTETRAATEMPRAARCFSPCCLSVALHSWLAAGSLLRCEILASARRKPTEHRQVSWKPPAVTAALRSLPGLWRSRSLMAGASAPSLAVCAVQPHQPTEVGLQRGPRPQRSGAGRLTLGASRRMAGAAQAARSMEDVAAAARVWTLVPRAAEQLGSPCCPIVAAQDQAQATAPAAAAAPAPAVARRP